MAFDVVLRGFPHGLIVAALAHDAARGVCELPLMEISMAGDAILGDGRRICLLSRRGHKRDVHVVVGRARPMAATTLGVCMCADQRKIRGFMIEPSLERCSIESVPAARVMTIGALPAHLALVIVLVTIRATGKSHVDVLDVRLPTTSTDRFVTLLARHIAVQAGQAIPGRVMIKPHRFIPDGLIVTVLAASVGELPCMRIVGLMASQARGTYTQERCLRRAVFTHISDDI